MKTTLDISDHIMQRTKELSRQEKTPIRELVEEGLELLLRKRAASAPYKIKPVVFKGKGLSAEYQDANWERIRDAIYNKHGS